MLKPKDFDEFRDDFDVSLVLAYCPFDHIVQRMFERNRKAIEENNLKRMRFFHQALESLYVKNDKKEKKFIL